MAARQAHDLSAAYTPPQPMFTPCLTCGALLLRKAGALVTAALGLAHECQALHAEHHKEVI